MIRIGLISLAVAELTYWSGRLADSSAITQIGGVAIALSMLAITSSIAISLLRSDKSL